MKQTKKEINKSEILRKEIYDFIEEKLNNNWGPEFNWDRNIIKRWILVPYQDRVIIDYLIDKDPSYGINISFIIKSDKFEIHHIFLVKEDRKIKIDFEFIKEVNNG